MPELPEVTTITNQLQKEIVGSVISDVQSVGGYKTQPEFTEFRRRVRGQQVLAVRRVAKNIVVELNVPQGHPFPPGERGGLRETKLFLVVHLAMTGRLLLRPLESESDPWMRLIFCIQPDGLNSTRRVRELRFCDSRMFGFVRLMNQDQLEQYASKYGPDALDKSLTPQVFLAQLKKKRTEVKRALLEQQLIAGAGNIYVNDSLWLAKIHPKTPTQQVTTEQATRLLTALKTILLESIEHRGSTLGDKMYIDVYGQEGEHQDYFRVFGKDGKECLRCHTTIEYIEIGGRGTFFCPKCQVRTVSNKIDTKFSQNTML